MEYSENSHKTLNIHKSSDYHSNMTVKSQPGRGNSRKGEKKIDKRRQSKFLKQLTLFLEGYSGGEW